MLYVAPERWKSLSFNICTTEKISTRLNNESFMELMRRVKISLLAVDESHCISQVHCNTIFKTWPTYKVFTVGCQFPTRILEDRSFRWRNGCRARALLDCHWHSESCQRYMWLLHHWPNGRSISYPGLSSQVSIFMKCAYSFSLANPIQSRVPHRGRWQPQPKNRSAPPVSQSSHWTLHCICYLAEACRRDRQPSTTSRFRANGIPRWFAQRPKSQSSNAVHE